jgi:transposase
MNRVFDREFKVGIVRRIQGGESISALSRELAIKRQVLYRWKYAVEQRGVESLRGVGGPKKEPEQRAVDENKRLRQRIAKLEQMVGKQQLAIRFFKKASAHIEGLYPPGTVPGGKGSTK